MSLQDPSGNPILDPTGAALFAPGESEVTAPVATAATIRYTTSAATVTIVAAPPGATAAAIRYTTGVATAGTVAAAAATITYAAGVAVVPVAPARTYVLAATYQRPHVTGPLRAHVASYIPPPLMATVYARSNTRTPKAVLYTATGKQFRDQLNEVGSGSLTLDNFDSDIGSVAEGDIIRFDVEGVAAFSMIASDFDRTSIAAGEEAEQQTTISGQGTLAILDEAVVYPSRGINARPAEKDRIFGWSSLGYNYHNWPHAHEIVRVVDESPAWDSMRDIWPNGISYWIWAPGATERLAPDGTCYFLQEFYVASQCRMTIYTAGDDSSDIYLDGQHVLESEWWTNDPSNLLSVVVELASGFHLVGAQCHNPGPPADIGGPFNPAGLAVSAHLEDPEGYEREDPTLWTDRNWYCLPYPDRPPGMTPGQVLRMVVTEAQARGSLQGVTLAFNDYTDTEGRPWQTGNWSTQVGTSVGTFVAEMVATDIDIAMAPGSLELRAWRKDGRGVPRSATLHAPTDPNNPWSGNLVSLQHRRAT